MFREKKCLCLATIWNKYEIDCSQRSIPLWLKPIFKKTAILLLWSETLLDKTKYSKLFSSLIPVSLIFLADEMHCLKDFILNRFFWHDRSHESIEFRPNLLNDKTVFLWTAHHILHLAFFTLNESEKVRGNLMSRFLIYNH